MDDATSSLNGAIEKLSPHLYWKRMKVCYNKCYKRVTTEIIQPDLARVKSEASVYSGAPRTRKRSPIPKKMW